MLQSSGFSVRAACRALSRREVKKKHVARKPDFRPKSPCHSLTLVQTAVRKPERATTSGGTMDLSGEYVIPASRETVWEALNNPDILRECIPGCEVLEMQSPTQMSATVVTKIGPVKAKFSGEVTLENINAPAGYTIVGEGKGGIAGFAKGGADVALEEVEGGTKLTYTAKAQVGGKIAQLGSRLIDSTAKKLADQFFSAFAEKLGG